MGKWLEITNQIFAIMDKAGAMLTDEQALNVPELYAPWVFEDNDQKPIEYKLSDRRTDGGVLYRCITAHTAQETWNPADAPSLWAKVLIPDPNVISEWVQPDSTNAYHIGDKVTHNGKTWICTEVDGAGNNTWEPGVYGWSEM